MKSLLLCLALSLAMPAAAPHPLDGKWFGTIDTDRGTMQIGLELKEGNGKLAGAVKSPHGDWVVKSVSEAKGTYTVTFTADEHDGTMIGTVKDGTFSGKWDNSPMATGTFELKKAAPKQL